MKPSVTVIEDDGWEDADMGGGGTTVVDTKQSGCNWGVLARFVCPESLDFSTHKAARDTQSVHVSVTGQPALFRHAYYPVNTVKN